MAIYSSFLPGKFHGQRSLPGYSPWDHKESDTTEHAHATTIVTIRLQNRTTTSKHLSSTLGFTSSSGVKASACNAGDLGLILGLGRSPGEGNGNPLQYSCLENFMDRRAWQATVHGVAESRT